MRILPPLTAGVVALALYGIVFERDRLIEFAGGASTPDAREAAAPDTATPAEPAAGDGTPRAVSVVAIESVARTIDNTIPLRGQTEAVRQVEARAETSGLVISHPTLKGGEVAEGDILCEIEPGNRPAQLAQAEARLAEAQISNTAASRLAEGGFASETRAVGALAELSAAQAAVDAAKTEIRHLTIQAPFGGILETDTAELGSLMQPGALCATILQLDPIKLVGYLPEALVDQVSPGAPATARLATGREIAGEVTFVARSADPSTRTFRVEISAANPDGVVRDGQSADIAITADGISAHLIPAAALTLDDQGTMGLRIADVDDVARFVPVRLVRDTTDGVLLTGLPDTARVIVVGQEFVTDGVAVRVTLREGDA